MKKRTITALLALLLCGSAFAVHEKYEEGYVFVPSVVNTDKDEVAISYVGDKVIYSKFTGGKYSVYQAVVNDTIELQDTAEMPDFKKLGMYGTVAYDNALNRIYYSRYESRTKGYMLYQCTPNKKGQWKKGKRLKIEGIGKYRKDGFTLVNAGWLYRGPGISGFLNPNLTEDGSRLYFTSIFESGKGGRDIWFVDKKDDSHWTMPQNAGDAINGASDQDYAFASGDSLLYFASKDSAGVFNICVSRNVGGAWSKGEPLDSVYNSSSNDYNLIGNADGVFFISSRNTGNGEDIYRPTRIPEPEPEPEPEPVVEPEPEPEVSPFPWSLFYFDFDRDLFKPEFQADLDALYNTMVQYMDRYDFVVNGHTDSRGSEAYNMKLSYKRANRIRTLLIEKGFPAEKMTVHPYGETQLVIPDAQTEEEHAKNRRVEVDIVEIKKPEE